MFTISLRRRIRAKGFILFRIDSQNEQEEQINLFRNSVAIEKGTYLRIKQTGHNFIDIRNETLDFDTIFFLSWIKDKF